MIKVYRGDLAVTGGGVWLCLVGGEDSFLGILLAYATGGYYGKPDTAIFNISWEFKNSYEKKALFTKGRTESRVKEINNSIIITLITTDQLSNELKQHLEKFKQELMETDFV